MVDNLHHGGMERIVAELVRRVDHEKFDMHVMVLDYLGHFGKTLDTKATSHVAEPMDKWSMLYPGSLARQVSQIEPDVVHLHSGVLYKGSLAAAIAKVPFQIYTDHGRQKPDPWINRALDRRASRRIDIVAAVSEELRCHLLQFFRYPDRVCVVQNGVDTNKFTPRVDGGSIRREIGIDVDSPIIGSTGRLEPVKGYGVLLSAFAQLRRSWKSASAPVLVIVGDGSERASLERKANQLGLSGAVHFVGWRGDIEEALTTFSVFAMSSYSEGTSVSLLEAMSAGVPPVVTDVGGNADVLGPKLAHRLVPAADPAALASALAAALRDRSALARDSVTARARVLERFSLAAMVSRYEALYLQGAAEGKRIQ